MSCSVIVAVLNTNTVLTCLVVGEVQHLDAVGVREVCGPGISVVVDLSSNQSSLLAYFIAAQVKCKEIESINIDSTAAWMRPSKVKGLTTLWSAVICLVSPLKKVTLTVSPSAETSFLVPLGKMIRRLPPARTFSV